MAFQSRIRRARHDVAGVQSALASVQTGLDVVETTAEAVDEVRRGALGSESWRGDRNTATAATLTP